MLISTHASETASVDPAVRALWVLVAFLGWGAILGRAGQRLNDLEGGAHSAVENARESQVMRIDRRAFS